MITCASFSFLSLYSLLFAFSSWSLTFLCYLVERFAQYGSTSYLETNGRLLERVCNVLVFWCRIALSLLQIYFDLSNIWKQCKGGRLRVGYMLWKRGFGVPLISESWIRWQGTPTATPACLSSTLILYWRSNIRSFNSILPIHRWRVLISHKSS